MEPLTMMSSQGGCAAKVGPRELEQILTGVRLEDQKVEGVFAKRGDAGYIKVSDDLGFVQSIDVITPVSDDPYVYGAIAVEHALSDICAVGGDPLSGMFMLAYPALGVPATTASAILQGAIDRLTESGARLLKGHTIGGKELQFGVAVTGLVHGEPLNARSCQPGDLLVLTKPLGNGIIVTAQKMVNAGCPIAHFTPDLVKAAEAVMLRSNRGAARAMLEVGVNACTDITGFGLIGHLMEMLQLSGVSAELDFDAIPVLPGVMALAEDAIVPSGSERNAAYWWKACEFADGLGDAAKIVLFDAQTSGGLLVSLPSDSFDVFAKRCQANGLNDPVVIGRVVERPNICVRVSQGVF